MPDQETERFAGAPLEPTPQFVDQLRDAVVGEWRGEVTVRTTAAASTTRRRRPWVLAAGLGAAAAAVLAVTVVSLGDDGDSTTVPATDPTIGSSVPDTSVDDTAVETTFVSPLPAGVAGLRWVITEVDGVPLDRTNDLPSFTITPDGEVSGFDGCNTYVRTPDMVMQSTAVDCPGLTTAVLPAAPIYLRGAAELTAGTVVAVHFTEVNPTEVDLANVWHFDSVNSISWNADPTTPGMGSYIAGTPNACLSSGTFTLNADLLQLTPSTDPTCAGGDAFAEWVSRITSIDVGVTVSMHGPELWVSEPNGRVTRLSQG